VSNANDSIAINATENPQDNGLPQDYNQHVIMSRFSKASNDSLNDLVRR
jgi:hypothetical protein